MNEKFDREYINSAEASAPDMDRLWERISSSEPADTDITPFVSAAMECNARPVGRNTALRGLSAAAVFIAVICAVSTMSGDIPVTESDNAVNEGYSENYSEESSVRYGFVSAVTASSGWDYNTELTVSSDNSYYTLSLAETDSEAYTGITDDTWSDEYFVEENILMQTDMFLDCEIISADHSEDGGIIYSVRTIHAVCEAEGEFPEYTRVYSDSPYSLKNGREYLLPIQIRNGRYIVVFDNAPQIEFTLDRQLVAHNGWESLSENGVYLNYPQTYPDDFFYDRMNLTAEYSLSKLFEKWEKLRA